MAEESPSINDRFGWSVAIHGDTIVVGALLAGKLSGLAFVFRRNGSKWEEEAVMAGDFSNDFDRFGEKVAVFGDVVAVASQADGSKSSPGAVYVYRRSGGTWPLEAKLMADDPNNGGAFGSGVAILGDTMLIGAIGDSTEGSFAGAVYVYEWNGGSWNFEFTIQKPDPEPFSLFGTTRAFDGTHAIVTDGSSTAYMVKKLSSGWSTPTPLGPSFADADVDGTYVALDRTVYALDAVPPCIPATTGWTMLMLLLVITVLATLRLRNVNSGASRNPATAAPPVLRLSPA